ncbi:MAG TPA: peptide ABC transporter substrate-binding protein [Dehalococcoidia bacterium]|nr:peptide ABC transporter substrate-binding protein [Dehalococcoidia bacterium]
MPRGWLLAISIGALLLVACSTSSDVAPQSEEAASQSSQQNAAAATDTSNQKNAQDNSAGATRAESLSPTAQPDSVSPPGRVERPAGGRLVRLFSDPPTLDPHITTDSTSAVIVNEVFGGLVTITPDIVIAPDLAEDWDISPDGKVFTFRLRQDAKFHDGRPVVAEDFRWSLERAADPLTESPVADLYLSDVIGVADKLNGKAETIQGLRVIDERTLELTIDAPKSYFLAKLTYPTAFVVDRKNVEGNKNNWVFEPNGTGPFRLERYDIGETILLGRNENYHLGPPFLDEVEFILSGGDPMLMYENDEIHVTGLGLADLERVQDPSNPLRTELATAPPGFTVSFIGMNLEQPPFDDVKFRQALNYAVNKKEIATTALSDLVVPAIGVIPPGFPSYNPDLRGYGYDPEKAKRLLSESRYGADPASIPRITLSIAGNFGASVGLDMEVMLRSWQETLGVEVEIQQTEWATFLQDVHQRRFQMFALAWSADYPDPQDFLDIMFHTDSANNWGNYNNREVDSLLEKARVEPDQTARFQQYNLIEQLIVDDAPWVPLWHSTERKVLVKPEVKDYFLLPMTIPKLRHVYITDN